jgi:osomolarity two-component system response regulator SSK1
MTPRVALPLTASVVEDHARRTLERVRSSSPGRTLPSPPSESIEGPLLCIFEIVHNVHQPLDNAVTPKAELNPYTRLAEQHNAGLPKLDSLLCRRLLQQQNASLKQDTQPSSPLNNGRTRRAYELSVLLARGSPFEEPPKLSVEEEAVRQPFVGLRLAREPTLPELSDFAESLRGKKVVLHASLSSVFARHLTSYLGAWGLDISHIPIEDHAEMPVVRDLGLPGSQDISSGLASMSLAPSTSASGRDTDKFIIIDDDVAILRRELLRIRTESSSLALRPRLNKRPTLISRARSTPHVRQMSGSSNGKTEGPVLIHFTSLARYNQVRDVISNLLGPPFSAGGGAFGHTEVMVIPKPVGPRRFLTALHTAVNQPVVDPFFSPIATSPRSPGGGYFSFQRTPLGNEMPRDGFFDTVTEEAPEQMPSRLSESSGSQKARSPLGEFPPSAAQIVRTEGGMHLSLPTPGDILATPASEYFSNTKTSSSGASGVVMQSPDGRPYGMFFEPPIKNERRGSYTQRIPSDSIRRRSTRRTSGAGVEENNSPTISPNTSRKLPNVLNEGAPRGATPEITGLPQSSSKGSISRGPSTRRKTLPDNVEPIIAVGRDRSATVGRGSKRNTPGSSPVVASPKNKEEKEVKRDSAIKPKADAPVVPPINVLIVEGES